MENNLNNITKPKVGERYKNLKYRDERKHITKQLLRLLKIDTDNKIFTSYDLDQNKETQNKILEMIPEIEKYYTISKWNYWHENKKNKKYMSLTKSLLKDMGITFIATNKKIKQEIKMINYIQYTITSDINAYLI